MEKAVMKLSKYDICCTISYILRHLCKVGLQ